MIYSMTVVIRKMIYKVHSRFLKRVLKRKEMMIRLSRSRRMVFPLCISGIGWWLAIYRTREPDHLYMINEVLSEGNSVLDIGANIGYYVLIEAELMNGKGVIYAYEPDNRNIEFLKRNVSINGLDNIVDIFNVAVSNKSGYQEFNICEQSNLSSLSRSNLPGRTYIGKQQVKVVGLNEILKQIRTTIDLLRMDIEGHEIYVFSSLIDFIRNEDGLDVAPNAIVFETHPWEYQNKESCVKLFCELFSLGYNVRYIATKREDDSPFHEHGYKPIKTIKWWINFYGIYENVDPVLSANLICNQNAIRTVCLQKKLVSATTGIAGG